MKTMIEKVADIDSTKFLDFEKEQTQSVTLEQLEMTHRENDVYGKPLKGIYHFELMNSVIGLCKDAGYDVEVYDLFAAQNRDRNQPGVVLLPQVEEIKGERSIEAHILRRVYANIRIKDFDNEENTTNLAVAFHQKGIQVGFGRNVKICHNQCMLNPSLYAATYGEGRRSNADKVTPTDLLDIVKSWLVDARRLVVEDDEKIAKMHDTIVPAEQLFLMIGMLTAARVKSDTKIKEIRSSEVYPLNQSQISQFTEDMLVQYNKQNSVTLWDVYNSATNLYKPGRMDIPMLLPQNRAMVDFINQMFFEE